MTNAYFLLRNYGLTLPQYKAMREGQNNKCGICQELFTAECRPAVDHDHETDFVRGLLCVRCNTGLGFFRDDPVALRAAIDYITKARQADPGYS